MHNTAPRPRGRLEYPSAGALQSWLSAHQVPRISEIPQICTDNLGFYLFLNYCSSNGSAPCALFVETVAKYKVRDTPGRCRRHRRRCPRAPCRGCIHPQWFPFFSPDRPPPLWCHAHSSVRDDDGPPRFYI